MEEPGITYQKKKEPVTDRMSSINESKTVTIAALVLIYAAFSIGWLYIYSTTSFNLIDTIDFNAFFKIMDYLPTLFITGLLLSCSLVILSYFSMVLGNKSGAIGGAIGSLIAMIVGMFFFKNISHYFIMMFFHMFGTVWIAYSSDKEFSGSFSKMKFGWSLPKKMILMLEIGAVVTSVYFIGSNPEPYQENFKEGIVSATGGMDMGSIISSMDMTKIISRDDVAQMVDAQTPSYEDFKGQMLLMQGIEDIEDVRVKVEEQFEAQPGWNTYDETEQERLIDEQTQKTWDSVIEQVDNSYEAFISPEEREKRIDFAWTNMQLKAEQMQSGGGLNQESMEKVTSAVLDKLPMIQAILQLLPIMSAFIAFSAINLFGTLCVSPFTTILALVLKEKKRQF